MTTFQDYLDRWWENKSLIRDNNIFYFDRDIISVLGLDHFPLKPGSELRFEDQNKAIIRASVVDESTLVPDIHGIEFKTRLHYASSAEQHSLPEDYLNGIKGMLEYCVKQNLRAVWFHAPEVIATHLVK